ALVQQRIDSTQGEIIDAPYRSSNRPGRAAGQLVDLLAETYVSCVNGGVHFYIYLAAALLLGEDGARTWPHGAAPRWQKLNGKPYILRLRPAEEGWGYTLRQRRGRPHTDGTCRRSDRPPRTDPGRFMARSQQW